MSDAFDNAEFYDCRDSENLSHRSVEEAIEDLIDVVGDPAKPIAETIIEHSPVEIFGFCPRVIDYHFLQSLAIHLREEVVERLAEEFGDDGDLPSLTADVEHELQIAFEATLERIVRDRGVESWQCETVGRRTYSAAEVEAILRDRCPEWFEEPRR